MQVLTDYTVKTGIRELLNTIHNYELGEDFLGLMLVNSGCTRSGTLLYAVQETRPKEFTFPVLFSDIQLLNP